MEKPISIATGKFRTNNNNNNNHNNVWFVVPLFFILCFVLLCFDYSALFTDTDETAFSIPDVTQKSTSSEFTKDDNFSRFLDDPSPDSSCSGRYIYVHELPYRDSMVICLIIALRLPEFMLEVIFHNKMMNYRCLTNDSSLASAVFVPFYAGLDMSRYLWGFNISVRDSSSHELMDWLVVQKEWGRILRFLPESRNMSMLSIESSSWNNDYAIPYPTCFHPRSVDEIVEWQELMRSQKREYLFTFAGAPRPEYKDSVRGKIIDECLESKKQCYLLDCNYGNVNCDNPVNVMKVFRNSVFCLQPPGDSYTRRSMFDSILAGCILVFFHPGTAYAQYKWHLPKNHSSYSVYLPVKDVKEWNIKIKERLIEIPEERVVRLREEVLRLIPKVVYADPKYGLDGNEDAFELAVKGMLERIEEVREMMRQGKDGSDGFDDRDDYKYTFSPYEEPQVLA
ncbi:unnamed protein product [Arabidopsis halleri]